MGTVDELAMRVVNLREALGTANRLIEKHAKARGLKGYLMVGCDELGTPTFRRGRAFWSKVRKLTKEEA